MAGGGYQYGTPGPVAAPRLAIQDTPRCWGLSFEEHDSECRSCSVRSSCRDEIFRRHSAEAVRPFAPPAPSYVAPQPVRPYAFPQPMQSAIQPFRPTLAEVARTAVRAPTAQPAPVAPVTVAAPTQQSDHRYGWLNDPLYHMIHSAPPPMRGQMDGETFVGRVAKNTALAMLEKGIAELFLALRQAIFAPRK